jgi:hypothetical protein
MPLETFYFNLSNPLNGWVRSFEQPTSIDPPIFGLNDNRDFEVVFLKQVSVSRVEKVQDVIGARIGLANGATALTSATAGAADNLAFPFVLPISGSNINTLMTGKTVKQRVDAEFKLTTALGTNRFFTVVYIAPQINSDAVPDPAIEEPATTMSEVKGVCVQKEPPVGLRMIWTDETTGQKYSVGFRDGQFKGDLIET